MSSGWALATTWPNGERKVCEQLIERELAFHSFKRRILVAHRGKLVEKLIPAFPRYVFVPFARCWEVVKEVVGIVSLVSFESKVAFVRDSVVEDIRTKCIDDVLIEDNAENLSKFKYGDEVLLANLASTYSQFGKYHHSDNNGRAVVVLEWMGRSVFVNIDEADLVLRVRPLGRRWRRRNRQRRTRATITNAASRSHTLNG